MPSELSAKAVPIDNREIDIDFHALVEILSEYLYKDKSAALRELLSNANDSLTRRAREAPFGEDERPAIRLWLDRRTAQLVVRDNGIGMSKDDLIKYLATIGASLTKEKRLRQETGSPFEGLIGRFGIGFLSSFIIASKITLDTRKPDGPGYRWESQGDREYTITEREGLAVGTTVVLDLKSNVRQDWDEDRIKRMVLENARNFVFPIFWGGTGEERLNDLQAPWYADHPLADDDYEKAREFLVRYDERFASAKNATEIMLLHDEGLRGVVYVPPLSSLTHETLAAMDLYCKRVFVKKNDSDIVPREFPLIKGIVDCSRFRLNAARDDVIHDTAFDAVVESIGDQIMTHFCKLAGLARKEKEDAGKPQRFAVRIKNVMDQFQIMIKAALAMKRNESVYRFGDSVVTELQDFIPFRSSLSLTTTLPEYLARMAHSGRPRQILTLQLTEDVRAYQSISAQEKAEFILVQAPFEEEYLKRYAQLVGVTCKPAPEVLKESFPVIEASGGWLEIVRYYRERLNHAEFTLTVCLSEFEPHDAAGRLLADSGSEGQRQLQQMIEEMEKEPGKHKDSPIYQELLKLKQKSPHLLYLNRLNPALNALVAMRQKGTDVDLDTILHPLFHDMVTALGHPILESHLLQYQTKTYSEALAAQELRTDLRLAQTQLKEIKKEAETQRKEIAALQQELEKSKGTTGPTTNHVFFIRPMSSTRHDYGFLAKRLKTVCEGVGLKLIDPKELNAPGDILKEILAYLRESRFVIADVSETDNANVYYEAGYVHGHFQDKLILIADKPTLDGRRLPFDIATQRVLGHNLQNVPEFDKFVEEFERLMRNLTASEKN